MPLVQPLILLPESEPTFLRASRPVRAGSPFNGRAPRAKKFPPAGGWKKNKLDKSRAHSLQSRIVMKKDPLAALLVGLLFVNGTISAVVAVWYGFDVRDLRRLQPQTVACQTRLNLAQALLNDALEYSKRNPAINPLLQSLNPKANTAAAPAAPGSPAK